MDSVVIRRLSPGDVPGLLSVVGDAAVFRSDEVEVAREVLEAAVNRGEASGYLCSVAEVAGEVAGYVCYGATPCTVGTFDLYWLAVHPRFQGRGLASRLLAEAIGGIQARAGRLLVVETSDTGPYGPARCFYETSGFSAAARIPDFYRPGDAKVIYVKPIRHDPNQGGEQGRWNCGRRS